MGIPFLDRGQGVNALWDSGSPVCAVGLVLLLQTRGRAASSLLVAAGNPRAGDPLVGALSRSAEPEADISGNPARAAMTSARPLTPLGTAGRNPLKVHVVRAATAQSRTNRPTYKRISKNNIFIICCCLPSALTGGRRT